MNRLNIEPAVITIFGITGDLAKRKLLPALYDLVAGDMLPEKTKIVGLSRRDTTVEDVIAVLKTSMQEQDKSCDPETLKSLADMMQIIHMDIAKADDYAALKSSLDAIEDQANTCLARIFYLAVPSPMFKLIAVNLAEYDLNTGCQHDSGDSRLLMEKPFGYDYSSAKSLIKDIQASFNEEQIYRIDHYLAKETVQNILTFRFKNSLFAGAWDAHHIDRIDVSAIESIDIEGRAHFYESVGAYRDVIQSHLLQLVALVTMDQPDEMTAEGIHEKKTALLSQIRPPKAADMSMQTARKQYIGYRDEVDNQESMTETFAQATFTIDSQRWKDVPIKITTGKALSKKRTDIRIFYKSTTGANETMLGLQIQPDEEILLDLDIKKPGYESETEEVRMNFNYKESGKNLSIDAYERVLIDALRADKTLFATSEEVLACWQISQPVLDAWANNEVPLESYEKGTRADD